MTRCLDKYTAFLKESCLAIIPVGTIPHVRWCQGVMAMQVSLCLGCSAEATAQGRGESSSPAGVLWALLRSCDSAKDTGSAQANLTCAIVIAIATAMVCYTRLSLYMFSTLTGPDASSQSRCAASTNGAAAAEGREAGGCSGCRRGSRNHGCRPAAASCSHCRHYCNYCSLELRFLHFQR